MGTINHEYYVSFEVAKLLKEAGFDWEVKTYYRYLSPYDEYILEFYSISTNYNHLNNADFSAPSLDVAQRWLREVKGFNINTCWLPKTLYGNERFVWNAYFACDFLRERKPMHDVVSYGNNIEYCTYEEAQEAGIKKALEIILEEGE